MMCSYVEVYQNCQPTFNANEHTLFFISSVSKRVWALIYTCQTAPPLKNALKKI